MSKIYEALLRAESERKQAQGRPGESPAEPTPAQQAAAQAEPRERVLPQATAGAGQFQAAPTTDAFLADLRVVTWSPDWKQLYALEERGSTLEQFRTLRSRIQEFQSLNTLKTILVSSGKPREGKSFVSVNLALSLARYKESRVLLIDGDMRRSSLQSILGTAGQPGLTEYLSGEAPLAAVLQRGCSAPGERPLGKGLASLLFLPAGADAENAADLSGNSRFGELIRTVSPHVDWIIIDSSPVNLVNDAVNLARAADAVLLVAQGGVTTFQSARRAMSELKSSNLIGIVLNAVHDAPKTEGYYGHELSSDGPAKLS